jgi:hypothetical protein
MEPEGSLLHSRVPAPCPYPEAAQSSPYPHILLSEGPVNWRNSDATVLIISQSAA